MRVLLLRPVPANDRFGLGPSFRIEPLGIRMHHLLNNTTARRSRVRSDDPTGVPERRELSEMSGRDPQREICFSLSV